MSKIANDKPLKAYSTPYIEIMNATIAEFFEPRRNPDAKKFEIVEWVRERMKEAKLPESESMATAIFTISKPSDHDPRKQRS